MVDYSRVRSESSYCYRITHKILAVSIKYWDENGAYVGAVYKIAAEAKILGQVQFIWFGIPYRIFLFFANHCNDGPHKLVRNLILIER